MNSDKTVTIFEGYLRATDGEIKAALEEDGAGSTISVDLYKRAASLVRARQAAKKALGR